MARRVPGLGRARPNSVHPEGSGLTQLPELITTYAERPGPGLRVRAGALIPGQAE